MKHLALVHGQYVLASCVANSSYCVTVLGSCIISLKKFINCCHQQGDQPKCLTNNLILNASNVPIKSSLELASIQKSNSSFFRNISISFYLQLLHLKYRKFIDWTQYSRVLCTTILINFRHLTAKKGSKQPFFHSVPQFIHSKCVKSLHRLQSLVKASPRYLACNTCNFAPRTADSSSLFVYLAVIIIIKQ